ncbi:MAG: N-acetylmuramoyl-L-alanine amidase [Candidatus Nanoarchaeia archaeon]|nr:N-acetylmuramoyl-L-alanine amidase [Candidatus Nanoarchaeia archaeon]
MNKKGADKFLSIYWFLIIFLVAGAVVFMAALFYGSPYDVRKIEAGMLGDRIADCLTNKGYFDSSVLSPEFKENFLQECHLTLDTEDFSDWKTNKQYYFEVHINEFDSNAPENLGLSVLDFSAGNINLKKDFLSEHTEKERVGREIDTIVIHFTASSNLELTQAEFANTPKGIHYLIDKDGTIVRGDTPDSEPALHTNNPRINARSIGIELINLGDMCGATTGYCTWNGGTCKQICQDAGNGENVSGIYWEKFPPEQITALENLVSELVSKYDIPVDREHILGHYEIDPSVRTDPGPLFPWTGFMGGIKKTVIESSNLGLGRKFYAVDNSNNKYVVEIPVFVGKADKNA